MRFDVRNKIYREILHIALPLVVTNILQQLYNMTDAFVAGKGIGDFYLSAVGASGYIVLILTFMFLGLTVGASISISHYYGANDTEKISKTVHTGMGMALLSGAFLTVVGYIFSPVILKLVGVPMEVYDIALDYLRVYFLGTTFVMIYNMGGAILRGIGNTKIALFCLTFATISNVFFDSLFVFYFGLGIKSIAFATVISQFISACIIIFALVKRDDVCKLKFSKIRIEKEQAKQILSLGLPSGLQSVVQNFSNLYVQTKIYTFGAIVLSGVTAYTRVEGFFYMAIEGIAVAVSVISGQLIGMKKSERIPSYAKAGIVISSSLMLFMSIVFYIFDNQIIGLFVSDESAIKEGVKMLRIVVPLYAVYAVSQVLSNVIKGIGQTAKSMRIVLIYVCGFRVLWVTLVMIFMPRTELLYLVYPVSWTLLTIVFMYNYFKVKANNFEK